MNTMTNKEFSYDYQGKKIAYTIWFTSDDDALDTILFLGTVQIGKLPQWVAEQCPPRTAVVQGAPHWHAKADGSDIPEYMFRYTKEAFDAILAGYRVEPLHIIADSQAVPGVVRLFSLRQYSPYMKDAVLLQPLGFTKNIYDGTDKERVQRFKHRVIKNAYYQLLTLATDRRLQHNHRVLLKRVNFRDPKTSAHYNSGLKYDSLPDLKQLLTRNTNVTIVCGANDTIFPAREIEANLRKESIVVRLIEVKGVPHSPLAGRQGVKLLQTAFSILNLRTH